MFSGGSEEVSNILASFLQFCIIAVPIRYQFEPIPVSWDIPFKRWQCQLQYFLPPTSPLPPEYELHTYIVNILHTMAAWYMFTLLELSPPQLRTLCTVQCAPFTDLTRKGARCLLIGFLVLSKFFKIRTIELLAKKWASSWPKPGNVATIFSILPILK